MMLLEGLENSVSAMRIRVPQLLVASKGS
jgi:hypothetical protein